MARVHHWSREPTALLLLQRARSSDVLVRLGPLLPSLLPSIVVREVEVVVVGRRLPLGLGLRRIAHDHTPC